MRYKVELHIKETGPLSKKDFRKLQEAVNAIAEITEFKMVIDEEAMSVSSLATFMQMVPKKALRPLMGPIQFLPPNENDTTLRDTYGHDLPEDEKEVTSQS
jgi:hypothetical protein